MSNELEASMTVEGNKAKIIVEAMNKDASFLNFMSVNASVVGPDPSKTPTQVPLVQTGPGKYEAEIDANDPGSYVSVINYRSGQGKPAGHDAGGHES